MKLKELFDADLVRGLAADLVRVHPAFDAAGFVAMSLAGLDQRELTGRGWHLAEALHHHLPRPFPRAAKVLVASLGPELTGTDDFGLALFRYLPHVFFVQKYGLDDFEVAMTAQHELTRRFSAESSIRAFLVKYPAETYQRLLDWTGDPNVHVRRLTSEGTRPRLPWAPRLRAYQEDPRPVLALLERLKDDPERYVQRSVANNLNDIAKDHPALAVETCRRWSIGAGPGRAWIVKHALRSLVKQGHRGALEAMGAGGKPRVTIDHVRLGSRQVRLGGRLAFSFELASTGKQVQELLVDYAVHFVKANGGSRPKVFKLRRLTLPASARVALASSVSFADLTTRRHYPGRHKIEVLVNGVPHPLVEFDVAG